MTKISGKFYPLQHDEWIRACQELTPSQRDVLYFIRTLDPYGNGVKISAAEIARQLSTPQKIVHRQTISRALKELDARSFIDLELIEVQVRIKPKGYWCNQELEVDTVTQENNPEDEPKSASPENIDGMPKDQKSENIDGMPKDQKSENIDGVMRHQWCDETPQVIATHHDRSSHTTSDHHAPQTIVTHQEQSESQSQKEIQNPKTIKTYSDFLQTLSEVERESFLEFAKKKAAQLPRPPELPLKWIEKNFEDLRSQWEKQNGVVRSSQNWESDPRRQEWIDKIRSLGFAAFIYEGGSLDKDRKEFYEWANSNNLIWGDET